MLPLLLLGAGVWVWHRHKTHAKPRLSTPALAQLHGHLMGQEINPVKLEKAAVLFHQNGLTAEARNLTGKAKEVRKMAAQIPDVAHRARAGDENAMAILAGIREQAAKGDQRAAVSANLFAKFFEQNAAPRLGPLGEVPM